MRTPAVSILMPIYNEQEHLPAALASLQRQSVEDWELIAVDDGSTDDTPRLLAQAAKADRRIRVHTQANRGIVAALNAGLNLCRAPLVARMDADDISHPHRLERQRTFLTERPHTDLVACCVRHFPRPRLQGGMKAYEEWQNGLIDHEQITRDLFVESPFAHPSVLFRQDIVRGIGGYRDRGWAEDYDLWLRLAMAGARFARLPETLLYWRDRPQRLTRTAANCSAQAFRTCKVHFLKQGYLKDEETVTLWGAGIEGKAWRKALAAEGITVNRWVDVDPRKIGQRIHNAPVKGIESLHTGQGRTLVTVGAKGARDKIRTWATPKGLIEGQDYLCVT